MLLRLSIELESGVELEVAFPGAPSLTVRTVSADVKQHIELEPPSSELRSCVKAEMAVLAPRP